jgi:hypothetical protein
MFKVELFELSEPPDNNPPDNELTGDLFDAVNKNSNTEFQQASHWFSIIQL